MASPQPRPKSVSSTRIAAFLLAGCQAPDSMKLCKGGPYRPASLGGAGQPLNQPRYFCGSVLIFSDRYCVSPRLPRWTTLNGTSASITAMATEECQPLARNSTPCRVIASVTARTAFSGLDWLSMKTISTSRCSPSMVSGRSPSARASSSARATPFLNSSPVRLAGPVNGPMEPILSGPAPCARSALPAIMKAALAAPVAAVVSRNRRRESADPGTRRLLSRWSWSLLMSLPPSAGVPPPGFLS